MLERVVIDNFRTIRHIDWQPRALNILVGTNNAGKSNVCHALAFLARASSYEDLDAAARDTCGAPTEIVARDAGEGTVHLRVQAFLPTPDEPQRRFEYDVVIRARPPARDGRPSLAVESEVLIRSDKPEWPPLLECRDGTLEALHERSSELPPGGTPETWLFEPPTTQTALSTLVGDFACRSAVAFRLYLKTFRYHNIDSAGPREQAPSREGQALTATGSNLFSVLFAMRNEDERTYRRLFEAVSRIEPRLDALNFIHLADGRVIPELALKGVGDPVSLAAMSDGTLRYMALVTAALQPEMHSAREMERPTLIMLEEPENGLYVRHQGELVRVLTELATHTQTIVTTHNPFLLDYFDDRIEDIVVVSREDDERGTTLRTPNREAVLAMLDRMSPGEMLFREVLACE